jgi:hypothetical protein
MKTASYLQHREYHHRPRGWAEHLDRLRRLASERRELFGPRAGLPARRDPPQVYYGESGWHNGSRKKPKPLYDTARCDVRVRGGAA